VRVQRDGERRKVGDVVDDVMAHHHVGRRSLLGHVGPVSEELRVPQPAGWRGFGEGIQHRLLVVHADDVGGRRGEGECRPSPAAADVQDAAAGRERFEGALTGGTLGRRSRSGPEQLDRVDPRRAGSSGEDLVGDPPAGELRRPPFGRTGPCHGDLLWVSG
jgi:hypothetical protein